MQTLEAPQRIISGNRVRCPKCGESTSESNMFGLTADLDHRSNRFICNKCHDLPIVNFEARSDEKM